ncbi:MAG TPA: hypothetical protein VGY31_01810 [Terriglobia bacterium]|nr:hypothetical protein [Terriglobia bacterium]
MTDRPYILKRLILPLSFAASALVVVSYYLRGLPHDLLVSLAATFVGSILTVAYIDTVLQRRQDLRWAGLRSRAAKRLFALANACITSIRSTLKVSARVVDDPDEPSLDLRILRTRMIRVARDILPQQISQIRDIDSSDWGCLCASLGASIEIGDRLLGLFGREFPPRIAELVLDIQSAAQGVISQYTIWPDLLGVPADRLPRKRNGSSSLPTQQAAYRLAEREALRLLELCAELLGQLDDLPSDPN